MPHKHLGALGCYCYYCYRMQLVFIRSMLVFEAGAAVGEETGKCLDPGGEGAHWRFVLLPKLLFAPNSTFCSKNYHLHQKLLFAPKTYFCTNCFIPRGLCSVHAPGSLCTKKSNFPSKCHLYLIFFCTRLYFSIFAISHAPGILVL